MLFRSPCCPVLLAALALPAAGCTSGSTTTLSDTTYTATAIIVRPAQFLGDTPCSAAPGAMRSYVATLVDHTYAEVCKDGVCEPSESGLPPFTLPSSLPTSCSQGVRFDNIAAGHRYSVYIDGYEAFADEICPEGCIVESGINRGEVDLKAMRSGSRHMQLAEPGGDPVEPRWLGGCGNGDRPRTVAAQSGTTLMLDCEPMLDTAAVPSPTAVELSPQDTLGSLSCAAQCSEDAQCASGSCDESAGLCDALPGERTVATFDIEPDSGLGDLLGLPCDAPFVQTYSGDKILPGEALTFFVAAHELKKGPVVWGAECTAVAQGGVTVRAACAPLSSKGSLRIDIASALAEYGVECSGDISSYDAALPALGLARAAVPCDEDITFGPLDPGDYTAEVVIHTKDQNDLFSASCTGAVVPGRAIAADCQLKK